MANKRVASLIIIVTSLLIVCFTSGYKTYEREINNFNSYDEPLKQCESDSNAILHDDYTVDENFTTHLPIVILDTNGVEVPINTIFDEKNLIFTDIKGLDPYVGGTIQVIDNGGIQSVSDVPSITSQIEIKRRGNTSMYYNKPQYLVKLQTKTGQENELSILGMGQSDEWVLNGSMTDKSMMRNYLAYRIASQIMPYTPDSRYCEVLIKEKGVYYYQGVYLFGENVKQGENRVEISDYKASETYNSYLVRRDRLDEDKTMLQTYATSKALTYGHIGLIYPGRYKVNDKIIAYAENDISKIEKILYSEDFSEFSRYSEYIDVDSYVDYFIVNEFFMNYDAGKNSTYMYKEVGGKLTAGPVWDFDGAMDNYIEEPVDAEVLSFQSAPWFDRLITDKAFVSKLEKRYSKLRRGVLSEQNILNTIDEIKNYLGDAQQREWTRWTDEYLNQSDYSLKSYLDDDGDIIYRITRNYEEEIYRLKNALRKHGAQMGKQISSMEHSIMWNTNFQERKDIMLLFSLALFCIPAFYINRN